MEKSTTTCDACGRRYTFTSIKDRCPLCCPRDEPVDCWDESDFVSDDPDQASETGTEMPQ